MWRWVALVVLVVTISAIAAWLSVSMEADSSTDFLAFPAGKPVGAEPTGPQPKIELSAEAEHDFGIMAQQTKGTWEWVVKNAGEADLILTGTQPTCSCTVIDPKPDQDVKVAPGESYTVRVEWETRQFKDKYEKNARILTNDPKRPDLNFVVTGVVQPAIMTFPEDGVVNAQNVSNDGPHEFRVFLASPDRPETKIVEIQTSRPDLLDVKQETLTPKELEPVGAKAGYKLTVVVKPTPSLGVFREEVIVKTDHPLRDEVRLTVAGQVVGPITVTPAEGVRLANVEGEKGKSGAVFLTVRGQEKTNFEVTTVPGNLKVEVVPLDEGKQESGASKAVGGGLSRRYRVDVAVPAGSPPGVITKPIVLRTDHPMAAEVQVPVYVRVLGKG